MPDASCALVPDAALYLYGSLPDKPTDGHEMKKTRLEVRERSQQGTFLKNL